MASQKITLKLLVDKKVPRVLFAEVPKEFVDFLFHMFSLPLGTLIELLGSHQMVGSLGKLKDSIESFNGSYLQPGVKVKDIFYPKTAFNGDTFLLSYDASSKDQSGACQTVYKCSNSTIGAFGSNGSCNRRCCSNATLYANSICPICNKYMNAPMTLVTPKEVAEPKEEDKKKKQTGYVKEVVTYMVMDDFVVKPMSTISSITLINKLCVKDLSQLVEKTVSFGKDEGLKLLNASLKTDKVLTAVFMD